VVAHDSGSLHVWCSITSNFSVPQPVRVIHILGIFCSVPGEPHEEALHPAAQSHPEGHTTPATTSDWFVHRRTDQAEGDTCPQKKSQNDGQNKSRNQDSHGSRPKLPSGPRIDVYPPVAGEAGVYALVVGCLLPDAPEVAVSVLKCDESEHCVNKHKNELPAE